MKKILFILCAIHICSVALPQSWHLLPASPEAGFRHDDLFFINKDTGWVVNVDGYIYKTTDGGNTFTTQLSQPATSFRCVGFADALKGWAGNLGPDSWSATTDTNPLYQTTDGGNTWEAVSSITGPLPAGICGINVVNENVVYAVGRVGGPCYIMKTIDGGSTWTSVNFDPPAYYLIDCKFFSADTGIVAGCTGTSFTDEKIAVWRTTNGGDTWDFVYHDTSSYNGHCWKIDFPSKNTGYISIEPGCICDTTPVLKTTDGGLTWEKKIWDTAFSSTMAYVQGVGFINDDMGWCGNAAGQVKQTTDGGNAWDTYPFVPNFNRFRKVNDTVAYASGSRIWKYSDDDVGINEQVGSNGVLLNQNFPNPFSEKTMIGYYLPHAGEVIIRVYDGAGRPVKTLVNEKKSAGSHQLELQLPYYYDAHFYYTLRFENVMLTKRTVMMRE